MKSSTLFSLFLFLILISNSRGQERNRKVRYLGGDHYRACEDENEERTWCSPAKKCRACGFKPGGPSTPTCWVHCRHYECVCKRGYSYNPNGECVLNSECHKYLAADVRP